MYTNEIKSENNESVHPLSPPVLPPVTSNVPILTINEPTNSEPFLFDPEDAEPERTITIK